VWRVRSLADRHGAVRASVAAGRLQTLSHRRAYVLDEIEKFNVIPRWVMNRLGWILVEYIELTYKLSTLRGRPRAAGFVRILFLIFSRILVLVLAPPVGVAYS
jgi:hypothetical protein